MSWLPFMLIKKVTSDEKIVQKNNKMELYGFNSIDYHFLCKMRECEFFDMFNRLTNNSSFAYILCCKYANIKARRKR